MAGWKEKEAGQVAPEIRWSGSSVKGWSVYAFYAVYMITSFVKNISFDILFPPVIENYKRFTFLLGSTSEFSVIVFDEFLQIIKFSPCPIQNL